MHETDGHDPLQDWLRHRTFRTGSDDPRRIAALTRATGATISVVLPALDEEATIGAICSRLGRLVEGNLIHQLIVLDSGSTDLTALRAAEAGATVLKATSILPEVPLVPGKGEALWRSLAVTTGDIVVYLDADVTNFDERFVLRLIEPLLEDPAIDFVKAFYERPLASETSLGGGRVTEIMARPLLNLFYPELAGFIQPLAGECAARADLLRRVPFFCGYGVEIGLLIDVLEAVGVEGMGQVDLEQRVHRNRATAELGPMAFEIMRTVLARVESGGRIKLTDDPSDLFVGFNDGDLARLHVPLVERPPMRVYGEGSSRSGPGATGVGSGR